MPIFVLNNNERAVPAAATMPMHTVKTLILPLYLIITPFFSSATTLAEAKAQPDSMDVKLNAVQIVAKQKGLSKPKTAVTNSELISSAELTRAACCSLAGSFTTNPSVDVAYDDAATGAKQIKLLGLSGTYVQMLTESMPDLRGLSAPYGLSYIPGRWIESIQVSKGAASVKSGAESITGQINVELLKPQGEDELSVNAYASTMGEIEGNVTTSVHLSKPLSTALLLHYQDSKTHDGNDDGFIDLPSIQQFVGMNRWAWMTDKVKIQAGVSLLDDKRHSGQHHACHNPFLIDLRNTRVQTFGKAAYIFDPKNAGNIALLANYTHDNLRADYGDRPYHARQNVAYGSLMFERNWQGGLHALSAGLSINYDGLKGSGGVNETVNGAYAQYTLNLTRKLLAMAGLRYDHSSLFGSYVTPRLHVKWTPSRILTIHGSAGRGVRSSRIMPQYHYLLASSRKMIFQEDVFREDAWNFGVGASCNLMLWEKMLNISGEYYYTRFRHRLAVDLDSDPHQARFIDVGSHSRNHTVQLEVGYPIIPDMTALLAYRYTDVSIDYGNGLVAQPLTSRSKGLLTLGYSPMMGIWQFDVTFTITGGGRMPTPYKTAEGEMSWEPNYKAFCGLNAQITRNFPKWAVYIGGENLTGYRQKSPIIAADNPWGDSFDPTMIYGPLHGAMFYAGFRYNLKY